jgi:hypothetical protein
VRSPTPRSAKKGFLILNRTLADEVFRDQVPDAAFYLVKMVRAKGLFSARTPAEKVLDSLHMIYTRIDE